MKSFHLLKNRFRYYLHSGEGQDYFYPMQTIRIQISGRVYKTGYRYFLKQIAEGLHISGTIKYAGDHQVRVIAYGSPKNLETFITYCRLGCLGSDVRSINIKSLTQKNDRIYDDMKIIETQL